MSYTIETMTPSDWDRVREIYQQGILTGQATFETTPPASWTQWDSGHLPHPRIVARRGDEIVGWAALSRVSARAVYAGVAEVSVYVAEQERGKGLGALLLSALIEASEGAGIWTLQASIFPENDASRKLHLRAGFREVGRRERIARHHGVWRDTLLLERRSPGIGTEAG